MIKRIGIILVITLDIFLAQSLPGQEDIKKWQLNGNMSLGGDFYRLNADTAAAMKACIASCRTAIRNNDYLVYFNDTITDQWGYKNSLGDIVIPLGKYQRCFTDTFKTYAFVAKPNEGIIAIDRQEKVLYEIFFFDNGPDEASEGLFRILLDNKIGYADSMTGKIMIKPRFDCAWPFDHGVAKVSTDCKTQSHGEHNLWASDHWFYIDKSGKKVE